MGHYEQIHETAQAIRKRAAGHRPKVGIILGSGLGEFAGARVQGFFLILVEKKLREIYRSRGTGR